MLSCILQRMGEESFKYVFGPVPSRRLGRSLGVDLIPFKTCTYDCLYCQVGRTTDSTIERKEYVPVAAVLDEIDRKIAAGCAADYITFSGSGEPTLHSGIGRVIISLKEKTNIPVAVITNGSLLWDEDVRKDLMKADLVIPSLDAGNQEMFERVNRPHSNISFEKMVDGIESFTARFPGKVWLEIFLLDGLTTDADVERIAACARRINPDAVQLNTAVRPTAEESARPIDEARMREMAGIFGERAEVIAAFEADREAAVPPEKPTGNDILDMLRRRPCSIDDIAAGLGIPVEESLAHIETLLNEGRIRKEGDFYVIS